MASRRNSNTSVSRPSPSNTRRVDSVASIAPPPPHPHRRRRRQRGGRSGRRRPCGRGGRGPRPCRRASPARRRSAGCAAESCGGGAVGVYNLASLGLEKARLEGCRGWAGITHLRVISLRSSPTSRAYASFMNRLEVVSVPGWYVQWR